MADIPTKRLRVKQINDAYVKGNKEEFGKILKEFINKVLVSAQKRNVTFDLELDPLQFGYRISDEAGCIPSLSTSTR